MNPSPATTTSPKPPVSALPTAQSLPGAARAARLRGEPLVVMTTLRGCPYCDLVRGHYLGPMQRDGELVAIQVDMTDARSTLIGFDGATTTPRAQTRAWKASMAPTVLFLGPRGEELAERLVGVAVEEMYGDFLQARLQEARTKLAKMPP
jgi:hypothetical protein